VPIESRRRRTRAEQSEETQRRLLDAAFEIFTQHGFHAATLEQVADAAGHTTGAVYSRFSGKSELLLAVIERSIDANIAELRRLHAQGQAEVEDAWIRDWWRRFYERPGYQLLLIEFRVHIARQPALRERYLSLHERHLQAHAEIIADQARQRGQEVGPSAVEIVRILMALTVGLSLERLVQGDVFDRDLPFVAYDVFGQGLLAHSRRSDHA
jgi:AcrR family transcriptional regulator